MVPQPLPQPIQVFSDKLAPALPVAWSEAANYVKTILRTTRTLVGVERRDLPYPSDQYVPKPPKIRIALLTPNFRKDGVIAEPPTEIRLGDATYKLHTLTDTAATDWRQRYLDILGILRKYECHFICTPELCFPKLGAVTINDTFAASLLQQALCQKCYIIAGSYHCFDTFRNRIVIISPHQHTPFLLHDKLHSAVRLGEQIAIPSFREVNIYQTPYARFAVLICLDSYDPLLQTLIINANKSRSHPLVDLVFIPSFTDDYPRAAKIASTLSKLAGCAVVLSNGFIGDPVSGIYMGSERPLEPLVRIGSDAVVYEIDRLELGVVHFLSPIHTCDQLRYLLDLGEIPVNLDVTSGVMALPSQP